MGFSHLWSTSSPSFTGSTTTRGPLPSSPSFTAKNDKVASSTAHLPDDRSSSSSNTTGTMMRRKGVAPTATTVTEIDRSRRQALSDEETATAPSSAHSRLIIDRVPVIKRDCAPSHQQRLLDSGITTDVTATEQDITESSTTTDYSMHSSKNEGLYEPLVVAAGNATGAAGGSSKERGNSSPSSASSPVFSWDFVRSPSAWKAISSCILYSFCSVSMILTNKSLASSYNHLIDGNLNVLLVVFQALAAVILVEGCRLGRLVEYPPLSMATLKAWAPVNIFFCLMLFTGMASLQTNSVPMVTVFKNVANLCTATGDFVIYGNRPENLALAAFGIMLGGAVFAAFNDLSMTFIGLFWMVANCLSTSGYVLYMKHATQTIKMNKFGMVFVNNVLCVLFLLPVATLSGEVSIFLRSPSIHTWDYFFKNAFAGFVGFFLNFASLNCVAAAGATTYAIVGSLNKVPVAVLGFLFFRSPMTQQTAFFIAVSLCGGFLYSYAKLQTARAQGK